MSSVYLIRHGQGGSRDDYDRLSDTGRRQAALLGQYFRSAGIRFKAAWAGGMRRQRETAGLVLGEMEDPPPAAIDSRWNEFSLEGLWKSLAPRLLQSDPEFAADHERLHVSNPNVDRVMTGCDVRLIRTWVHGREPVDGVESWGDFRTRVEAPRAELERYGPGEAVAVFTSATPTSVWCGSALSLDDSRIFRIAGVIYNTSFTTFRLRPEELTLFSLNNTPHLTDPALRTFR
jgi:broad specificity phosphatase PhoE